MPEDPADPNVPTDAAEPVVAGAAPGAGPGARTARTRVLKGAHAAFNQEFSAIPCQIRNISDTGARLIFEGGWFVPDRFMLHVDIDGYKIECARVWHKGSECGVRFTGERIATGRARQQVIAPEARDAGSARPDPAPHSGPRPGGAAPQTPFQGGSARPGGFGRRTR